VLRVDSILLDATEWLCRRFQVLTGRTNVWLAFQLTNFSIVVFFVWAGMHFQIGGRPFRIALTAFCGGLLYLLTQTLFRVPVETLEKHAYRRVSRGFRNPRRVRDAMLRIAFLTFSVMLFFPVLFVYQYPQVLATLNLGVNTFLVAHGLTVLTTAVLYLLACDPLPPCEGKARVWLRSLVPARRVPAAGRSALLERRLHTTACRDSGGYVACAPTSSQSTAYRPTA
jgi:hypothetical protein